MTIPEKKAVTESDAWAGKADCRNCQIRNSALFSGLSESDFEEIHKPITQTILQPGEHLYQVGDTGQHIFTIRHGLFKLSQFLPDGTQRIVRLSRSADVIGMEALRGNTYRHEATALQESEVCHIPVSVIHKISEVNPALMHTILDRCQLALTHADRWLTELSTGSAKQRVARLILCMVKDSPDKHCSLCSREDMGAMLGITFETASRAVADLKRKGYLTAVNTRVVTCDVKGLEKIAHR